MSSGNATRKLRSQQWFDNPDNPGMTALYMERYLNYGLTRKELQSGKVEITSQNHGFAVDPGSLPADVTVTHQNLYDGTVEGFRHTTKPIFSVQYHPEASPGPHDADYLFRQFVETMEKK